MHGDHILLDEIYQQNLNHPVKNTNHRAHVWFAFRINVQGTRGDEDVNTIVFRIRGYTTGHTVMN